MASVGAYVGMTFVFWRRMSGGIKMHATLLASNRIRMDIVDGRADDLGPNEVSVGRNAHAPVPRCCRAEDRG